MTAKVFNFDDYAADLHLSEWSDFIALEVEELEEAVRAHDEEQTDATKAHVLDLIANTEALLRAARRTLNKGGDL